MAKLQNDPSPNTPAQPETPPPSPAPQPQPSRPEVIPFTRDPGQGGKFSEPSNPDIVNF